MPPKRKMPPAKDEKVAAIPRKPKGKRTKETNEKAEEESTARMPPGRKGAVVKAKKGRPSSKKYQGAGRATSA